MRYMNIAANGLFDVILAPFRAESAWPGLCAVALVTSVVVLLLFRLASNPAEIRRRRNRLLARVLELVLFKDDLVVNLSAFGRVLAANGSYLGALLLPFALSFLPVVLILIQSQAWFGLRPLLPGESAVVTARFVPGFEVLNQDVTLSVSEGLQVEAGPVRVPSRREMSWVLRGSQEASGWAEFAAGGQSYRKSLLVDRRLGAVSDQRVAAGGWSAWVHPREPPFPPGSVLECVTVAYPERVLRLGGRSVNWVLAFFVLTMAFGLLLKRPMGAEF